MGSPLAPTLASLFLSNIEKNIDLFIGNKPLVYKRYVDDIFLIFNNQVDIEPFLNYMNSLHGNIKFTTEIECKSKLSFLDLLIERKSKHYETEIYHKPTDTGLYTSPVSFCESRYKYNMIKGLLYRSWTLSSSYLKSCANIQSLTSQLNKNGYSKSIVEKLSRETIDKIVYKNNNEIKDDNDDNNGDDNNDNNNLNCDNIINDQIKIDKFSYVLTIPYSEGFKQFKSGLLKYKNDSLNFKIVSQSYKIISMFSNKSKTPIQLCSDLVYKYECNGCNATYIGETSRHLCTRIQEHRRVGSGSNIAEHNINCKSIISINNFKILCKNFKDYWERVMCEALMIRSIDPKINVQTGLSKSLLNIFN